MKRRTFLQAAATVALASGTRPGRAEEPDETGGVANLTVRLNPKIRQAREAALNILKPSARELGRGLRLHAESLVFDAYGFSPRAAVDGDALAAGTARGLDRATGGRAGHGSGHFGGGVTIGATLADDLGGGGWRRQAKITV